MNSTADRPCVTRHGRPANRLGDGCIPDMAPLVDIKLSLNASAPESIESLREMLANLESQLVSLYEEKEHVAPPTGVVDETLTALYEDKQRLSARTIGDLQSTVDSLTQQLAEFYERREHGLDGADDTALHAMVESLTAQLQSVYEDREHIEGTDGRHDPAVASLLATVQSFEAQLAAFYADAEGLQWGHGESVAMVHSLTEQIAVLLEERNDLAAECDRLANDVTATKRRAREMVDAIVAQSLG